MTVGCGASSSLANSLTLLSSSTGRNGDISPEPQRQEIAFRSLPVQFDRAAKDLGVGNFGEAIEGGEGGRGVLRLETRDEPRGRVRLQSGPRLRRSLAARRIFLEAPAKRRGFLLAESAADLRYDAKLRCPLGRVDFALARLPRPVLGRTRRMWRE